MKRFRLLVRASDSALNALGARSSTAEEEVLATSTPILKAIGLEVEEIEGLDWWPDPKGAE